MKFLKMLLIMIVCFCLSGCWRYGKGETLGYITTVETGIFWDYVWIRAELESSQTNPYAINKNRQDLKDALLEASKHKQRVELFYYNHIGMACNVSELGGEVYRFKIIEEE